MSFRAFAAIIICKLLRSVARFLHRGGTAMPGSIALKICPDLLSRLSSRVKTLVITGTNGKTTSARMVEEAFSLAGKECIINRSGANLLSGITTEFVMNSTLFGRISKEYAVIECDEAAARSVFRQLRPRVVVVTNLFRDQLDRYGEVTHTLENVREGLRAVPEAILCLNADCSLCSSLALDLPNRAVYFGLEKGALPERERPQLSDATHCIRCKTEYEYDYVSYGHLGGFRCPNCGYRRHKADFAVENVLDMSGQGSRIRLRVGEKEETVSINLPAVYNIYNAVGAVAAVTMMGLKLETAAEALAVFRCGFGRMESFDLGQAGTRMMLVKNPAGCSQVIEFLREITERFVLVACLNDRAADGTDVSWIWDADFESLASVSDRIEQVIVSGDRAADLRIRFKYAGIDDGSILVERDYGKLIDLLEKQELPIYIMPTYTAMLELRQKIVHRIGGADFWE